MTVIKDDLKNIQRIVDVINSNPSILRQNDTDGLLRSVQFGNPKQMIPNKPDVNNMPYCYITTSDSLQKTSYPFGISSSSSLSQLTVEYKIVIVSYAKDKQVTTEKKLYNLLTLMRTILTSDPTFKDPISDDDPIFTRSIINESRWNTKTKGTLVQIVEFALLATIGSIGTISMPTINGGVAIEIISEAPDTEIEDFSPQFNVELLVQGYAPTGSTRSKTIEIDHSSIITEQLRTLKRTRKSFTLTTTDIDGTSTEHIALISNLTSNIPRIDNIKTDLIQFLIIP